MAKESVDILGSKGSGGEGGGGNGEIPRAGRATGGCDAVGV